LSIGTRPANSNIARKGQNYLCAKVLYETRDRLDGPAKVNWVTNVCPIQALGLDRMNGFSKIR